MAEETNVNEVQQQQAAQSPAVAQNTGNPAPASEVSPTIPYDRFAEVNKRMKEAEEKLATIQREAEAKERKRLEEQGQWEKIAHDLQAELDTYKPYKMQWEQTVETVKERNARRITEVPDTLKTLVPTTLSPIELDTWLNNNAHILKAPPAPATDAGVRGDMPKKINVQLNPLEVEMAKAMGLSIEAYAKRKAEIEIERKSSTDEE